MKHFYQRSCDSKNFIKVPKVLKVPIIFPVRFASSRLSRFARFTYLAPLQTLNCYLRVDLISKHLVSVSKVPTPGRSSGLFDCCSLCWPQGECYKPRRLRRRTLTALTSTEANLDDKFRSFSKDTPTGCPRGLLIHQKSFYDFILTSFGFEQSTNLMKTYNIIKIQKQTK